MKKLLVGLVLIFALACSRKVPALPQTSPGAQQAPKAPIKKGVNTQDGERKFKENCGRCHNPPDSLSPREVKAVVRHMRVRAMLSEEDAQLILQYLAP
jgi:mono/diheme cytochrome c family protein